MRRTVITAAILALVLTGGGSTPAAAHPGATVFQVGVGVATTIEILVPADFGKAINAVDVETPAGFRLDAAEAPRGWQMARAGSAVHFDGGTIPAYDPGLLFGVRGAALTKGMLIFPITTHSPDGSSMRYAGGPTSNDAGAVVYAGVTPRIPSRTAFPWKGVALGAVAAAGVAVLIWRRRS